MSAIKTQLNEILSAKTSAASSVASSRSPSRADTSYCVEVKGGKVGEGQLHPLQSLGLFVKPIPDVVRKSVAEAEKSQIIKSAPRSKSQEEEERKRLSKTINEELLKKVNFQQENNKKRINFDVDDDTNTAAMSSPRTCHSLERGQRPGHDSVDDDFILVLSDGEQKNDEVEETLDKWASAGESEDETKINEIRKRMKGRASGLQSSQSSDSISSGTSMHTVIYKGVKNKTNYFENIQAPAAPSSLSAADETAKGTDDKGNEQKTISEIKKDLEEQNAVFDKYQPAAADEGNIIPVNLVKEIRKSFENMKLPDPPTEEELQQVAEADSSLPPNIPKRSSSYRKSKTSEKSGGGGGSGSKTSLDRASPQSKSACSIPDTCKDEGYATFPNSPRKPPRPVDYLEKSYVPEKSISNVDLTDTETGGGLEETVFGRMHEKVHSLGNSGEYGDEYGFSGYKSLPYVPDRSPAAAPSTHQRAYLSLARAGDVRTRLQQFESRAGGAQLRSLPAVDKEAVRARATNTGRTVIRDQEVADTSSIKQRLESYEKDRDLFDYCAGMLSKERLKYFCKKVGHSKIISRMASLQRSAHVDADDAGFKKLNLKASAETEYISKYRSGEVEQKKTVFENSVTPLTQQNGATSPYFSWSNRFGLVSGENIF